MSSSTMFVTTTTKSFKSSGPISLSDYYFFCGFNICLLLESSPKFGVEHSVETTENVKEFEELIVAGFGYGRDRRGIEIYRKRNGRSAGSKIVEICPCRVETFINRKY